MSPRHVLITGATRGIGEALAKHYLELGDIVFGCGRGPGTLEHERYTHHCLDVTNEGDVEEFFASLRKRTRSLDILINNAGIACMNTIALTPGATARRILETNCLGTFHFSRAALRLLRHSSAGRIVNISSVSVPFRLAGEAMYAASKSAVETFTRIAAHEFAPFGITCNAVGPCPIKTRLTASVPEEAMNALLKRQPMPKWATPEDVVNIIDFLVRPESQMVTGQVIYLGGAS
jgi:3-oxoacyl-[acyl-carrier protein] reductase